MSSVRAALRKAYQSMKKRHYVVARVRLAGFLLASYLSGCSILPSLPKRSPRGSHGHAFIDYWPSHETSNQLRLAVKDNIDLKGVVTSAGSQYLEKTSPPASRDADCLAIARKRNVRIVGKTNLSE